MKAIINQTKSWAICLLALLFTFCTTEDEVEPERETQNSEETEEETQAAECTGDTKDINETYRLFDIDQPYKFNRIEEEGTDRSNKFIYTNGSYVCTGTFNETQRGTGDGNLALYSLNEDLELNWIFPKSKGEFYDVISTTDNNYVAVGRIGDKDNSTVYIVKLDTNGNLQWEYNLNTENEDDLGAFATTVIESPDGNGYLVFGKTAFNSNLFGFGYKSFLLNIGTNGEQQWVKSLNNTAEPKDVTISSNGNLILTLFDGDIIINEISVGGDIIASKSYGSSKFDRPRHILELKDGNYLVTGFTLGNDEDVSDNSGNADAWLLKLDKNLNLIKEQTLGGFGYQYGVKTFERTDGTLFMYGNTSNSDLFVDAGWNQEWYVELTNDLCILKWYKNGLYSDKKASDMIYFENENKMARFYDTNSEIYNNRPQEHYDHRITWLHFTKD